MSTRKKIPKACDECRSKKVRCDGLAICTRCLERNLQCSYTYVFKNRTRTNKPKDQIGAIKKGRGRPKKDDVLYANSKSDSNADYSDSSALENTKENGSTNEIYNQDRTNLNHKINSNEKNEIQLPIYNTPSTAYSNNLPKFSHQNYTRTPSFPIFTQPSTPLQQDEGEIPKSIFPCNHGIAFNTNTATTNTTTNTTTTNNNNNNSNVNFEERLSKLESIISLLFNKVSSITTSPYSPSNQSSTLMNNSNSVNANQAIPSLDSTTSNIPENPLLNDSNESDSNVVSNNNLVDQEECKWNGLFMHTSIFFLSKVGLIVLEQKMEKPEYIIPLKKIVEFKNPREPGILSLWINQITDKELTPLPSRENINKLILHLELSFFIAKAINFKYLKKLFKLYCDRRDGLISEPRFSYEDYFFMNSTLLVSCSMINEELLLDLTDLDLPVPNFEGTSIKEVENNLLKNSLFYYHKCSIISGGLLTVSSSLLLAFYADYASLSRASYLISSTAIRQAQELGLHIEEAYRGLQEDERSLRLSIWWSCYIFDKEMCVRWAQAPVINDKDVSAPPLPGFETFWSPNNSNSKDQKSNRSLYLHEIQVSLEPYLENFSKAYVLEQYLTTDYAFITSQIYDNFLRANALKNLKKEEAEKLKDETFKELEFWRLTIPEPIRPSVGYDEEFFKYVEDLKSKRTAFSIYKVILTITFYVRYHHVKLMVERAYRKYCIMEHSGSISEDQFIVPIISARCILRISCSIDSRFGNYSNFFIFYPFNSFLSLCGYYIYTKKKDENLESDLQLLIDCLRIHVKPFLLNDISDNRGQYVDSFLKGILYATYKTCINRFGKDSINLKNLEILNDINDLNDGKITVNELIKSTVGYKDVNDRPYSTLPYFRNQNINTNLNTNLDKNINSNLNHNQTPNPNPNPNPNCNTNPESNFYPHINNKLNLTIPNLSNPDLDRTPNVSFLLSPAHPSTHVNTRQNSETNSNEIDQLEKHWHKEGIFQNMLNIPNYFLDYMSDDHLN